MTKNLAYSLDADGQVISREATGQELAAARSAAVAKITSLGTGVALRSCWNCNPAHSRFLTDLTDGFLFMCLADCGRYFYQGIDITEFSD